MTCRMRSDHYAFTFAEWFAKYRLTSAAMPHVPTLKVRCRGTETVRCTWCYKPLGG